MTLAGPDLTCCAGSSVTALYAVMIPSRVALQAAVEGMIDRVVVE